MIRKQNESSREENVKKEETSSFTNGDKRERTTSNRKWILGLSFGLIATAGCSVGSMSEPALLVQTSYDTTYKPLFRCPSADDLEETNESGEDFTDLYGKVSKKITQNKGEFMDTFRNTTYDGWGRTYLEVKAHMSDFKSKYFCPHYKPGMKIYESACGIGLNLVMTAEILSDCQTSDNSKDPVRLYGNEYVKESVDRSAMVLADGILPQGYERGVVCTGDSTNLSHVPHNTFDLVYTGYITPIQDPLGIGPNHKWKEYDDICQRKESDTRSMELWNATVKTQNDWYGKWVNEMAKIAKPGAPIIVEQVSVSYCENQNDWGGVDPIFWFESGALNTYDWNIDPNSIEVVPETMHGVRYHVYMRKNDR